MGDFRPGSETWIDEVPVVTCQSQLSINELKTLNFHNNKALMPTGFEGIVIAGRIVDISPRMGNLQALLSIGELAGQTSVIIAKKTTEFPTIENISTTKKKNTGTISVQELFDGIDPGKKYKVVSQPSVDLPIRGKFDVLVVGGGTSGAISAIAAARQGANVCLIEILPNLGGISSNRVTSYYWGVPWKSMLRRELGEQIHLTRSLNQGGLEKVRFSGEDKKYALQKLALRAGVHIYYQSLASGAVIEGKKVRT